MAQPFRFGIQKNVPFPDTTWAETAKHIEDAGFSTMVMPDHFSEQHSPIVGLTAAAAATTTLRVGALVFGNDYKHPVVLAKEMASLDVVSEGRMEFGLGAGWMKTDYEQAGMSYDRPGLRIERLAESIDVVEGLFADGPFDYDGEHYNITGYEGLPKPVQKRPPLLLGGGGKRMLSLAAKRADIVGVTANLRSGEVGPDAIADSMGAAYDEKLEWVKAAAGDRFDGLEISSLTMAFMVTDDQAGSLELVAGMFGQQPDVVAQSPAVLVGSIGQIAETLQARRERWGFNYPVLQGETLDDLANMAQIVGTLAGT